MMRAIINQALKRHAGEVGRDKVYRLIAKELGCSFSTIRRYVPGLPNLPLVKKITGTRQRLNHDQIIKDILSGKFKTQREVAQKHGCKDAAISSIYMKYKLSLAEQRYSRQSCGERQVA